MFSQNPVQAIGIRFAILIFAMAVLFNAVQPVFAATEMALSGADISETGVLEMVEGLQTFGRAERVVVETVSTQFGW